MAADRAVNVRSARTPWSTASTDTRSDVHRLDDVDANRSEVRRVAAISRAPAAM